MVDIDALQASVTRQGALVRELKQSGSDAEALTEAITTLKALKLELEAVSVPDSESDVQFRKALDDLLTRKLYIIPSFEIYGGVAGFYDLGPVSCALKANMLTSWRRHFIVHDSMLEVECTNIMPEVVLKTSGHVDKFTDLMVKDVKTGECHRADKLVEDWVERALTSSSSATTLSKETKEVYRLLATRAESMTVEEMHKTLLEYNILAPGTNNALSAPSPFNLMFACSIGPEGGQRGYLRPETAQGIFINFRRLLEFHAGKLPLGVAQIGHAFRNEISPRGGLLRVREFQQAEIEYFVHPEFKNAHAKFRDVAQVTLTLFPQHRQLGDGKTVDMTMEEAVHGPEAVIANECLAYFMARTSLWIIESLGIPRGQVRFRQHLKTEMAHYACDCWDLEIRLGGSWVECAGHADRSCYDLQVHASKSKVEMVGTLKYDTPRQVKVMTMKINRALVGQAFKSQASAIFQALEEVRQVEDQALALEAALSTGTASIACLPNVVLTREMVRFSTQVKTSTEEKFIPSVIEPSFGVGRVLTAVLEHSFYIREGDAKRGVMAFPATLAPIKVSILPLSVHAAFRPILSELEAAAASHELVVKTDTSSVAIGRKYARADELGIPFNVTVDFETLLHRHVTLRERDSCVQVRVPLSRVMTVVQDLVLSNNGMTWSQVCQEFPVVGGTTSSTDEVSKTVLESTCRGNFRRPAPGSIAGMTPPVVAVATPTTTVVAPTVVKVVDEMAVAEFTARIIAKGDEIRHAKAGAGASKDELAPLVAQLLALKQQYEVLTGSAYIAPNQGSSKKNKKKDKK